MAIEPNGIWLKNMTNLRNEELKLATAEADANARLASNSNNKVLYIVEVEDPTKPSKSRCFAALKLIKATSTLEVTGIEISNNNTKNKTQKVEVNTYKKALEIADKGNNNVINIEFPWHRVISIKNVNYQHKGVKR